MPNTRFQFNEVTSALQCVLCRAGGTESEWLRCSCGVRVHAGCAQELATDGCPTLGCDGVQLQEALTPKTGCLTKTGCRHCDGDMASAALKRLEQYYGQQGVNLERCAGCDHVLLGAPSSQPIVSRPASELEKTHLFLLFGLMYVLMTFTALALSS